MEDIENMNMNTVSANVISMVEADSYWCLSALLDGIQVSSAYLDLALRREFLISSSFRIITHPTNQEFSDSYLNLRSSLDE